MSTILQEIISIPGIPIPGVIKKPVNLKAPINFTIASNRSQPLQPLVQAGLVGEDLVVSTVLFIAADDVNNGKFNFKGVNWQSVVSGDGSRQLDFFILYDNNEVVNQKTYISYRLDFTIPSDKLPNNISQIEMFLWDKNSAGYREDESTNPIGSRGTVNPIDGGGN